MLESGRRRSGRSAAGYRARPQNPSLREAASVPRGRWGPGACLDCPRTARSTVLPGCAAGLLHRRQLKRFKGPLRFAGRIGLRRHHRLGQGLPMAEVSELVILTVWNYQCSVGTMAGSSSSQRSSPRGIGCGPFPLPPSLLQPQTPLPQTAAAAHLSRRKRAGNRCHAATLDSGLGSAPAHVLEQKERATEPAPTRCARKAVASASLARGTALRYERFENGQLRRIERMARPAGSGERSKGGAYCRKRVGLPEQRTGAVKSLLRAGPHASMSSTLMKRRFLAALDEERNLAPPVKWSRAW